MKKILLLVVLLLTSVSLAKAGEPDGPLFTVTPDPGYIFVEVDVWEYHISFHFDHPVSYVCVKNLNTGASFSRYYSRATSYPDMDFVKSQGTWVVIGGGRCYGRFLIPAHIPIDESWDNSSESDGWGKNSDELGLPEFVPWNQGVFVFPCDWFDDGNGPVFVHIH